MGIRESRKKMQRAVDYLAAVNPARVVLHELTLLKQTVDEKVGELTSRLNEMENVNAPDTEEAEQSVADAAAEGFNTIYPDGDAG